MMNLKMRNGLGAFVLVWGLALCLTSCNGIFAGEWSKGREIILAQNFVEDSDEEMEVDDSRFDDPAEEVVEEAEEEEEESEFIQTLSPGVVEVLLALFQK